MCHRSIEGGDEAETVFEEIMANAFVKLMKNPVTYLEEILKSRSKRKPQTHQRKTGGDERQRKIYKQQEKEKRSSRELEVASSHKHFWSHTGGM